MVCAPRKATIAKRPCLISASRSLEVRALLSDASCSGSKKPPASPGEIPEPLLQGCEVHGRPDTSASLIAAPGLWHEA